jgi:probable HAF family extracellular repeat protein
MRYNLTRAIQGALALSAFAASAAFATPQYTAVDVNPTGIATIGASLNASGQVFGQAQNDAGALNAFVTGSGGVGFTDLGNFGADYANAVGSDSAGNIVIDTPTGGVPTSVALGADLATTTAIPGVDVVGVNASGQIAANNGSVGMYLSSSTATPTAIWGDGWQTSNVTGINARGQVVGTFTDADGNTHAFITAANGGAVIDLGALAGGEYGVAVNNAGVATGEIFASDFSSSDLLIASEGSILDAGTLSAGTYMFGQGINNLGQIVGIDFDPNTGINTPFLYANGAFIDLTSLIDPALASAVSFSGAPGINDAGQILLTGTLSDGSNHTYELTPITVSNPGGVSAIPEPMMAGLLGLGLVALGLRRKSRTELEFSSEAALA